jgi:hypothetical protein
MDPRRLLPVLVALAACAVLATAGLVLLRPGVPVADRGVSAPAPRDVADGTARAVLAGWDARRSRAWAAGDVAALRRLYVPGSRAGRGDVRMLRAYVARGLRVRGLGTQVLALRVVRESPRLLELVVTDRVTGGEAVGRGRPLALPADRPSTRRLVLRRMGGRWLLDEVRDQARAALSTAVTSSSSKS